MDRKLHIGGQIAAPGWEVFDAIAAPFVDHVGNARDLSRFEDGLFAEIYASHVVEHFDYRNELAATLREWHRVLCPGGRLFVSVPDLDILCHLFVQRDKLTVQERYFVMGMMFGGHEDAWDYHVAGLNQEFLGSFLHHAGFVNIRRVQDFGLFQDTSAMRFKGVPISLNMIAEKATG